MDEGRRVVRQRERAEVVRLMEVVRQIRRMMDYSITDFAALCGLSFKVYYNAESTGACTSPALLRILALLVSLDVPVSRVIAGGGFDSSLISEKVRLRAAEHRQGRMRHNEKADFNRELLSRLI